METIGYIFEKHGKGHGEFDEPHSIAINNNEDKLFVFDHSNNRIQVFTPQGEFHQVRVDYTAVTASSNQQMQYTLEASVTPMKDNYLLVALSLTAF